MKIISRGGPGGNGGNGLPGNIGRRGAKGANGANGLPGVNGANGADNTVIPTDGDPKDAFGVTALGKKTGEVNDKKEYYHG